MLGALQSGEHLLVAIVQGHGQDSFEIR